MEVQAQVYGTLDPRGRNQQFLVMEIGGTSQGKTLSYLIDSGSSHSFLLPSTIKRLDLHPQATGRNLKISLANGSSLTTLEQIVKLNFDLGGFSTYQEFRVLKLGKFQGILRMDWLHKNNAVIHCAQGTLSFINSQESQVLVSGRVGYAPLRVVKIAKLVKRLRKGLPIFVVKLNKLEGKPKEGEPKWLIEYNDVFPEELIDLPPPWELVHDIDLLPRTQPIARASYKMSLSKALELKH